MSQQDDQIIYDLMRKGDIIGWDLLFRKYHKPKYYQKHLSAYTMLAAEGKADAWGDATETLCWLVRTGKFVQQKEGPDFLLSGLISIARWKANSYLRRKQLPLVTMMDNDEIPFLDDMIEAANWEQADMLLTRICVENLNETRRNIILLKYLPEQPQKTECTDAQLSALLKGRGYNMSTEHVGMERRRAVEQIGKLYKQLNKKAVETDLKKTDSDTFMTVNVHFPTDELWKILYKCKELGVAANVEDYLIQQQTNAAGHEAPRRWLYPSVAIQCLEKVRNVVPYNLLEEKLFQWVRTAKEYFIPKR